MDLTQSGRCCGLEVRQFVSGITFLRVYISWSCQWTAAGLVACTTKTFIKNSGLQAFVWVIESFFVKVHGFKVSHPHGWPNLAFLGSGFRMGRRAIDWSKRRPRTLTLYACTPTNSTKNIGNQISVACDGCSP